MGNRLSKTVDYPSTSADYTHRYVYDASGNLMAIYDANGNLSEQYLYGLGRLGMLKPNTTLRNEDLRFEITDHLGSVRAVIRGKKKTAIAADIVQLKDYYSFGKVSRSFTGEQYRFGNYNGKEMDDETGWLNYGFRNYNPEIGRFDRVDPLSEIFPSLSAFQYAENCPIRYIDLEGLEKGDPLIFKGSTSRRNILAPTSIDLLYKIVNDVGLSSLVISSKGRTPSDQARIMYNNLGSGNSSSYGSGGRKVIKLYHALKKMNLDENQIKSRMEELIVEIGPSKVSKHCADPTRVNAVDFPLKSFINQLDDDKQDKLFEYLQDLEKNKIINRFLHPGNNPGEAAYHIEIPVNNSILKKRNFPMPKYPEIIALSTFVASTKFLKNNSRKQQNINYSKVKESGKVAK